jgi:hypothetical protein
LEALFKGGQGWTSGCRAIEEEEEVIPGDLKLWYSTTEGFWEDNLEQKVYI